jgi:hypothetical protein
MSNDILGFIMSFLPQGGLSNAGSVRGVAERPNRPIDYW